MSKVQELSEENIASVDNTVNNENNDKKILEIKEYKKLTDMIDTNIVLNEQLSY